jgi:hypothetical protein
MVRGLDVFREHFAGYEAHYVLIGGAACHVLMDEAGLEFRATKDLDLVLCVEVLDAPFATHLWQFIKDGGYEQRQKSTGGKEFYRFIKPAAEHYPYQLEFFARRLEIIPLPEEAHLTPIPLEQDIDSLSAILLDDDYYGCLASGTQEVAGIRVLKPEFIVPFKARAFLDLVKRKEEGDAAVKGDEIKKHRQDVFRLYNLLVLDQPIFLPETIVMDIQRFVVAIREGQTVDLKSVGIRSKSLEDVLTDLQTVYQPIIQAIPERGAL